MARPRPMVVVAAALLVGIPRGAPGQSHFQAINAVTFATVNMTASFEFYKKLGLACTFGGPSASFTTFGSPGGPSGGDNTFHINLFVSDSYVPPAPGHWNGWGRAIFYVDSVDSIYRFAVSEGLQPEAVPSNASWGERYFQILDPMGHEITIARPLGEEYALELPAAAAAGAGAPSRTMRAMRASGDPCEGPGWPCLGVAPGAPVPTAREGEALLSMRGSCVNLPDVNLVRPLCKASESMPLHCSHGTIGLEGAGVVAALGGGPACEGLEIGSEVWGFVPGAHAEYAVAPCAKIALKPKKLAFAEAGSVPSSGMTSLQCLKAAGAPWPEGNTTVAITGGQAGTGFLAVQLAKALGASRVVTAATGAGIDLVKSLGADLVVDYHQQDLFDVLGDDSVDVVLDNRAHPGTADRAMRTIRAGGLFLVLADGLHGDVPKHRSERPKPGVRQLHFGATNTSDIQGLQELSGLFDSGALRAHVSEEYGLAEVPAAFTRLLAGGVHGKLAVLPDRSTAGSRPGVGMAFV